jgi:DNA-binding transcriptional LysR family regulator
MQKPDEGRRRTRGRELPSELRLGDVLTFFAVQRYGAITGAARAQGVNPSQVSKAIARLEEQLHITLLSRSVRGVALTDAALRILPHLEQAVSHFRHMINLEAEPQQVLTVAGPSYLIALFLPVIARAQPQLRLCGLELPPAMLRARAADNFFDLSLIAGRATLPATWHSVSVGEIHKGVLARPELARELGPQPVKPERLLPIPFITPVYSVNGQFVEVDDDCPLSFTERRQGHKVQTIAVALEIASRIDQLVFGPITAARRHINEGRLVEVQVKGWKTSEALSVACNPERLLAQEHRLIVAALRQALRESS